MITYYTITMLVAFFLSLLYVYMWQKHFDVNITLIFFLIPIVNFGYYTLATASNLAEAILATHITYLGGCFAILFVLLTIVDLCHIPVSRYVRVLCFTLSTWIFLASLTIGSSTLFYKSCEMAIVNGAAMLVNKVYGPAHTLFYALVIIYFICCIAALIYSMRQKKNVSRRIIYLLFLPVAACMLGFFGMRRIYGSAELFPATLIFAQIIYLLIAHRLSLYNINDSGLDSLVEKGETGFASFDFHLCYLGSNDTARRYLPMLSNLYVDCPIPSEPVYHETILSWLQDFKEDESKNCIHYKSEDGEHTYQIDINYLYDGIDRRGYQLFLTDDTADVQYMELLDKFNAELEQEVAAKTDRIEQMHDKLILSMAAMVESRDNSTGGHIKRTSQGVQILIDEIKKDSSFDLSDTFCKNMIKAAPMHDLGKIAVDDAVLRKKGRFEPEEYEKMKVHAAEGARIVDEILKDTGDEDFRRIAVNVAHYHHERWDGSGYPEKLSGEQIPLEGRIMAIADVYDALVSKRVYKESYSFEKADRIIMEGMGTQFDPGLQRFYEAARPKLEAYYEGLSVQEK